MKPKLNHVGFSANRLDVLQDNPREVAFAKEWQKEQSQGNLLENLIPNVTQRDAQVAATVIQWLGSNIGMSFMENVCAKSEPVRRFLRRTILKDT